VNAINEKGETPLIIASSEGHFDIIRILLENNADQNIKSKVGYTALNWATIRGFTHIIRLLI
jgi:ankyrin repeat protein